MLAVEVIRDDNRHLHTDLLDEHFRLRNEIFVTERRWSDLVVTADGREIDQFDTPATVYLLVVDDGQLVGGCRLHPSLGPTLLSEIFPHLADQRGFERRPDVYEMTRGHVVRARREELPMRVSGAWKAAAFEYCIAEGIAAFQGVAETWFIPGLQQLGWQIRYLGLPRQEGEFDLVAVRTAVTDDALRRTWTHFGLDGPVTRWRGIGGSDRRQSISDRVPLAA